MAIANNIIDTEQGVPPVQRRSNHCGKPVSKLLEDPRSFMAIMLYMNRIHRDKVCNVYVLTADTQTHTYIHAYTYIHTHTYTQYTHYTYIHIYIYIYIYAHTCTWKHGAWSGLHSGSLTLGPVNHL